MGNRKLLMSSSDAEADLHNKDCPKYSLVATSSRSPKARVA